MRSWCGTGAGAETGPERVRVSRPHREPKRDFFANSGGRSLAMCGCMPLFAPARPCAVVACASMIIAVSVPCRADVPRASQAGAADSTATVHDASVVRIDSVSIPVSAGERVRASLRASVAKTLSSTKVDVPRRGYSVSVSLTQLRRYIAPGEDQLRMSCILDVALHDEHGALVASLRGRATGSASQVSAVLDAAAQSALLHLPDALKRAEARRA